MRGIVRRKKKLALMRLSTERLHSYSRPEDIRNSAKRYSLYHPAGVRAALAAAGELGEPLPRLPPGLR